MWRRDQIQVVVTLAAMTPWRVTTVVPTPMAAPTMALAAVEHPKRQPPLLVGLLVATV